MKISIVKPTITEKGMQRASGGWYTFQVCVRANKNVIRKEIERIYGVIVTGVRTGRMHGKIRRVGRKGKPTVKSNWKKILVRLKDGQTIEAFQIGGQEGKK